MNALVESPTTQDPTLQALVERGLRAARERDQVDAIAEPPGVATAIIIPAPRCQGDKAQASDSVTVPAFPRWRSV
jgi:hypothetical protein